MAQITPIERLIATEDIKVLRARYFRFLDTKDWAGLRELIADDFKFYFEKEPTPRGTGADEFVAGFARHRMSQSVSIHHALLPEIEILDSDTAQAIWVAYDWVDDPHNARAWEGYGYFEDTYRRHADGRWQIAQMRVARVRVEERTPTELNAISTVTPTGALDTSSS